MTYRIREDWAPVHWSPVFWEGSTWTFSARLTGLEDGAITGATLAINGQVFPVSVSEDLLNVTIPVSQADQVPSGAVAELFLDTVAGRILWIRGRVIRGGTP